MKVTRLESKRRGDLGQTLVEFALVVSLFFAIIFGIIEFGRLWFYSNHLNNSVRATARFASVLGSTPGGFQVGTINGPAQTTVLGYLSNEINLSMDPAQIDTTNTITNDINNQTTGVTVFQGTTSTLRANPESTIQRGDMIVVKITYNFHVLSGSIIPLFSGNHSLVRTASMRYEG